MPLSQVQPRIFRTLQLALFATSITWVIAANLLASRAARGLVVRFQWSDEYLLLDAIFLLFLLAIGFAVLQGIATPGATLRETFGLPRRPTSRVEWATGAAVGWALILVALLPMALGRALHIRFWVDGRSLWLAGLNLVTIAVLALGVEVAFRGYPYRRLIAAIGPVWATIVLSVVYGIAATTNPESTLLSTRRLRRYLELSFVARGFERMVCGWAGGCTLPGSRALAFCSGCRSGVSTTCRRWSRAARSGRGG